MSESDPGSLDRLHAIIPADRVPWWPPASGWYWVLGALSVIVLFLVLRGIVHWQRNRYRREALAEWARQERALFDPGLRATALAALAELLKRVALSAWPRTEVAALTGSAWAAFLDRTGKTTAFSQGQGAILEGASYDPRTAASLDDATLREVAALVRHWLTSHRRDEPC